MSTFKITDYDSINPPYRLLMGPGPISADPRVLLAQSHALLGQHDPQMLHYMNETMALYRELFVTKNPQTMIIDGTSRAGIEAILVSVIRPGDKVLIPIFGRFGLLLVEIARRCLAEVHTLEVPWGEVFDPNQIEDAIKKIKPRLLLTVHGETSTTMLQPLDKIGEICKQHDVLFYTDATASLGGNILETDKWHIDGVSAGLQKCLSGPSGSAPITLSERFVDYIKARSHTELGIRTPQTTDGDDPIIPSNYFDLDMIINYWNAPRLNHHTEAGSMLYASRECARLILKEGLSATIQRHKRNGDAMLSGIQAMGLKPFGNLKYKMNNIVGVCIPEKIEGEEVRKILLNDFGIEIGSSFGPMKGKVWRIGTMGYNARKDAVLTTLAALDAVLNRLGHKTVQGAALEAAWKHY